MTPDEWKVYFLVDGRRSLSEICRLAGNPDELSTLQILHHLVKAKFVAVVNPPEDETPVPPAAPARDLDEQVPGRQRRPCRRRRPGVSVQFQDAARAPRWSRTTRRRSSPPRPSSTWRTAKEVVSSRLVLVTGEGETSFPLTRDTYTIGRHRNNDIVISDPKVSSFHARIDRSAEGLRPRRPEEPQRQLRQRQADRDRPAQDGGRGAHGDGAPCVQGRLYDAGLVGILGVPIAHPGGLDPCRTSSRSADSAIACPTPTSARSWRRPTTSSLRPTRKSSTRAIRATSCASS